MEGRVTSRPARRRRPALVALLALGLLSFAGEPTAAARQAAGLLEQAKASYAAGDFAKARAMLDQASAATRDAWLLGQIQLHLGLAYAADNQLDQARAAFRAALGHDPQLRIDPHRYKPALVKTFEQVRQQMITQVTVEVTAAAAGRTDLEIYCDGEARGRPPRSLPLTDGQHRIELRDPAGRVLAKRQLVLSGGGAIRVELTPATPTVPRRREPDAPRRAPRTSGDAEPGPLRWTWVAAAGTVLAAALAIGFGVGAVDDRNEGCSLLDDKALPCDQRRRLVSPTSEQRYLELRDTVATKRAISNIAWVATGLAAATTGLLFWLERRARRGSPESSATSASRRRSAAPALLPGGAGLSVSLPF